MSLHPAGTVVEAPDGERFMLSHYEAATDQYMAIRNFGGLGRLGSIWAHGSEIGTRDSNATYKIVLHPRSDSDVLDAKLRCEALGWAVNAGTRLVPMPGANTDDDTAVIIARATAFLGFLRGE